MATLTSTAMARAAKDALGVNSVTVSFNSGSTQISNSATTILMAKLPRHCKILELIENHSTGALNCPIAYAVDSASSALSSALTQGTINRATKGLPYQVSLSDSSSVQYATLKAIATPGTATASLKINLTVLYEGNSRTSDI